MRPETKMEKEPGTEAGAEQQTDLGTELGREHETEPETEPEIEPGTGCWKMYHTFRNLHNEIDTMFSSKKYYY